MLSARQGVILSTIVNEYISRGGAVASEVIARRYRLGVSPATIRNDMARLEEEGYIHRPHPSAGAVPTHKGYRHFVGSLSEPTLLSPAEERLIAQRFRQVEGEIEEWLRLSASLLSYLTRYAAVVTRPRPVEGHFRHLDLVLFHRFMALLILALQEAWIGQRLLPLEQGTSQEELAQVASRLNQAYPGRTASQISALTIPGSLLEKGVTQAVMGMMRRVDRAPQEEPYFYGWRYFLQEPELHRGGGVLAALEALEGKGLAFTPLPPGEGVRVVIGEENPEAAWHSLSWVMGGYGVPNAFSGIVGVVGPTRMRYERAIVAVKRISQHLSQLLGEMYNSGE